MLHHINFIPLPEEPGVDSLPSLLLELQRFDLYLLHPLELFIIFFDVFHLGLFHPLGLALVEHLPQEQDDVKDETENNYEPKYEKHNS